MAQHDSKDKNSRILNMVVILVWLVVFMVSILGIVFPVVFFISLKNVYLKEQAVTVSLAQKFITDFMYEREGLLSVSANMPFMQNGDFQDLRDPEYRGIPENAGTEARDYFQSILNHFPSFRFFAYLTPEELQPVFLQPYSAQQALSREQYQRGYAYRKWAQKTLEGYRSWNKTGYPPAYISEGFISQPGSIPAVSISVPVVDARNELRGILYVNMVLGKLSEFIKEMAYGRTGKIYLVDMNGNLLAHPDIPPGVETKDSEGNSVWSLRNFADRPVVAKALKGQFTPGLFNIPETGKTVLASYRKMPDLDWIVILEQDADEAFSIVRIYAYIIIALVLVTIVVSGVSFLYIVRDAAASSREHRELLIISETDPLTGLLNRRSMLSRMNQLIFDYEQSGSNFVIALFDIDDFKKVNDTYGHVFGDVVLREIAARSVSILRVEDLLFRWGGEEFLLVIRNSDLVRGRGIAEKIRRVIADTPINDRSISVNVTVTLGVSQYHGGSIDGVIIHADEALYEGKRNGKNQIVVSDE